MPKSIRFFSSIARLLRHKEVKEHKPTEEMLGNSREPFRLMVESVKDYAIFMLDIKGHVVTWNAGAERIKGYKADEIIGKHFSIFYPDEDKKRDKPGYELDVATEVGRFEDEDWRIRKDGSRFWANVIITAIRDENGELRGFGKVTRDLTERKEAEEQRIELAREQVARTEAEAANRTKDEFLATVSHELRTPLNAILGWGRMLRSGRLDQESFARALETIERNAKAQARLIDDLLDVSRIISGKLRLTVRPVDLHPIIEATVETVQPAADAKGIHLDTVLDSNVGLISGDPDRLQQVVWNLVSNAVKFTSKGGRIQIRLQRINSQIMMTVSDTGQGISPDFLPYVFDRFRQADSKITRLHGGLGLGLSIVRHLVEMHGGEVEARSPGENKGSTFTVRLPVSIAHDSGKIPFIAEGRIQPRASESVRFYCPPSLEGLSILVIDDEYDALILLKTILTHCKAKVTMAASAAEAYRTLEQLNPDLIISDIGMPAEDGYSLIRKLRSKEAQGQEGWTPAIALTAQARIEDRLQALSAGYQAHVAKPVEPAELLAVIASVLGPKTGERSVE